MKDYRYYSGLKQATLEQELETSFTQGLSLDEVRRRHALYGFNVIHEAQWNTWHLLVRQFASPFMYLLGVALVISFFLQEFINGTIIAVIIIMNTLLGFIQEYRAQKALLLLRHYIVATARVVREGTEQSVDVRELVPGDLVILNPGDTIYADMRLIAAAQLTIDESVLTGESQPVMKSAEQAAAAHTLYEASTIVFAGTSVVAGSGRAIVTATGMHTEFGLVSGLTASIPPESNFQKNISRLSSFIIKFVLVTMVIVLVLHRYFHPTHNFSELFLFALALAVTITPEALPLVITLSLSEGALQLARHHVVVKRLSSLEDLGSITLLCTDKTGTLTENNLTVTDQYPLKPYDPLWYGALGTTAPARAAAHSFEMALYQALSPEQQKNMQTVSVLTTIPFDPQRRRTTLVVQHEGRYILLVRGAYEEVIKTCGPVDQQALQEWIAERGREGKRVLAIAFKEYPSEPHDIVERELTFAGLIAFEDPLKKSAARALQKAQELGIVLKIITGDSKEVAAAVAHKAGLIHEEHEVVVGSELDDLTLTDFEERVKSGTVFARITPQQKYAIIEVFKKYNTVAFMGEGINDVPALKAAHVGIVVQGGTESAQDAADIILLRKSLLTIIEGIALGRKVFVNTKKYIFISLSTIFGNFYTVAIASLFIDFLPLLPLQILLLNFLSDFPLIAIATDSVDQIEVDHPPAYSNQEIAIAATLFAFVSNIFDGIFFILSHKSPQALQTNWFLLNIFTELVVIFSLRTRFIFFRGSRPSWILIALACLTAGVSFLVTCTHWGQYLFSFRQPTMADFGFLGLLVLGFFTTNEIVKYCYYRWKDTRTPGH